MSALRRAVGRPESQVFDVVDGLVEQFGDVVVVQGVDHRRSQAGAGDQAEVAQQPQMMGAGRLLHVHGVGEFRGMSPRWPAPTPR
ncbi:hypothetical protein BJF79_46990 [Actinomadura sp. CNU-125]|nr:hypothetical protein BJF79_46990 [Actinomadura sp. CNU-125]